MIRRSFAQGILASVAFLTLSSSAFGAGACSSFATKRYTFEASAKSGCTEDSYWSSVSGNCKNGNGNEVRRFKLEVASKCAPAHQVQEAARQYCETHGCPLSSDGSFNGVRFKVTSQGL